MNTNILRKNIQNYTKFAKYTCDDINASIHSSNFHVKLKETDIVPLQKKRSKLFKEIYISISILPNFSKVYERCLYDQMSIYFKDIFFENIIAVFVWVTGHNITNKL